jgi:23S rRNA (uracil1939-C5)-methyltransferase
MWPLAARDWPRSTALPFSSIRPLPVTGWLPESFKKKRNYAEAVVQELLTPSPMRVNPPCPYSGFCGGCKWQFIDYPFQIELKRRHVAESLEHIALISGIPFIRPCRRTVFGYRNKMEFSCSDRRWLMPHEMGTDADISFALGLHVPGTFHKVLDTRACLLQPEAGNRILGCRAPYMRASTGRSTGCVPTKASGGFSCCGIRRPMTAGWSISSPPAKIRDAVMPLADLIQDHRFPEVVSVVNNITARRSGVAIGEREIHLAGEPVLTDRIGPFEFDISANSFFQTNTRGAQKLYETVGRYAALNGTRKCWICIAAPEPLPSGWPNRPVR